MLLGSKDVLQCDNFLPVDSFSPKMLVVCFVGQGKLWRALLGNKDQCVHFLSVVCNLFSPDDAECVRVQPWRVLMPPAVAVTSFSPDGARADHLHKMSPALVYQCK